MPSSVQPYLPGKQAWSVHTNLISRIAARRRNVQTSVGFQSFFHGSTAFKVTLIVGLVIIAIVTVAVTVPLVLSRNMSQTATTSMTTTAGTNCTGVLYDLTLVAYFPFDSGSIVDIGPYPHQNTYANIATVSGERNQALYFTGNTTLNSYFQISNLTSLGTSDVPYSISLWLNPTVLYGDVVFVTINSNGIGGYCFPFLGFVTATQRLAAQVWDGGTAYYAIGPILPLNTWTHVVETWSPANGLNLYINGTLYATTAVSHYGGSGTASYMTIASTMSAYVTPSWCTSQGVLVWNYYNGAVDELRIYNRELNATDVYSLSKC